MTAQMDHFLSRAAVQRLRGCRVSDHENLMQTAEQLDMNLRAYKFTSRNSAQHAQPISVLRAFIRIRAPNCRFSHVHAALVRNFYFLFIHEIASYLFYFFVSR